MTRGKFRIRSSASRRRERAGGGVFREDGPLASKGGGVRTVMSALDCGFSAGRLA